MNKKSKKYLIYDKTGEEFLIAATDIRDAEQVAAGAACKVKAVWFEHPSNRDLDDKWEYV